jgi:Ca2+-binding RTX toxin-like protein
MLHYIASVSKVFSSKSDLSSRKKVVVRSQYGYESLEQRRVLAGISFDLGSGFITITGSSGNDASVVSHTSPTQIQVALTGFAPQTFTASQVNRIYFIGMEGDDFFKNDTSKPSEAEGGLGSDTLIGGFVSDMFDGNEGNDIINGNDGDDLLNGGDDNDRLNAGVGNDVVYGGNGVDTMFGVFGTNRMYGGDGDDLIYGGSQDDQIWGELGNDTISTGEGNNFVDGGDGNDNINSSTATSNTLIGGNGNDRIVSGNARSRIEGGEGDDILNGGNGIDDIFGDAGNDVIRGGILDDFVDGGLGNDSVYGDDGNDEVFGRDGADRLFGGKGNDRMLGGEGNDEISGNDGNDEIYGENGDDSIYGGNGNELIRAGGGNDRAYGQDGQDTIFGQDGNDIVNGGIGDDALHGQEGDDTLIGDAGDDRLYGYNGNDVLNAGSGNNGLFGGNSGVKTLVAGTGKNRFLLAETATNNLFGFDSNDVQILFRNGLRTWSNVEITVVDEALHAIHLRAGNTKIFKPTLGTATRPIVFIKENTLSSGRYGSNELATVQQYVVNPLTRQLELQTFTEHRIRLPEWNEFDATSNLNVRAEVARELAYNWASAAAMTAAYAPLSGVFPRFANLSGWTDTEPEQSLLPDFYKSQDNLWWYFRTGLFTENFATYNPAADFAASFKYYFDPRVNPTERIVYLDKMEIIDDLFAKLAPF